MKETIDLASAEKLFERGKYSEAKKIFLEQKTPEANFYLALMAEKGLGEGIDKDSAKDLYEQAFDKGSSKAGIYLARMYQKEGSEAEAIKIYTKIEKEGISTLNDTLPMAYAKYRLARIDSVNSFTPLTEKRKKSINERYKDAITLYNQRDPGSRAHAKAIYHQALFKLKLAENDRNILAEARNLLKQAAEMDYNPAKAEVLSMDSNSLIHEKLRTKSFERALANSDKALELDPKNVRAKLLKSRALMYKADDILSSGNREQAMELYDQSRTLAQEISSTDLQSKQQQKILDSKLAEIMKEKCSAYLSESLKTITPTYWDYLTKTRLPDKNSYLKELSKSIASAIETNPDFLSQASFREVTKIAQELSEVIFTKNEKIINKALENNNDNELTQDMIKHSAGEVIQDWTNLKKVEAIANSENISPEDKELLKKRQEFQEKVEANFLKLYILLEDATSDNPTVDIKIKDSWFEQGADVAQNVLPTFAGLLGPIMGGHWVGLASTGVKLTAKEIHKRRQNAVNEGAKKFCKIGDRDINEAQKYFKEVAHELVNRYGMQIDDVDPKSIDKLAKAAVDKMVAHVTTETAFYKSFSLAKIGKAAINIVANKVSNEERVDPPPVQLLLDGIIEGKSPEVIKIQTVIVNGKRKHNNWLADGIFAKTAITNVAGTKHYERRGISDHSKYGYRYMYNIPSDYTEKQGATDAKFARDLGRHKKLIKLTDKNLLTAKNYNLIKKTASDDVALEKEKRELSKEQYGAIAITLAGAIAISSAIVISIAIGVGLLALPLIVEAAVVMIAGSFICTQGAINLSRIHGLIETLPERYTYEIETEIKPEISKEQLKAQHKSFVEKLEDKAKPSYKSTNTLSHSEKLKKEVPEATVIEIASTPIQAISMKTIAKPTSSKTKSHREKLEKSSPELTGTKTLSHKIKPKSPTAKPIKTTTKSHAEKERSKKDSGKDLSILRMRSKY